jgi:Asp/Glu/hydantoin racemase
MKKLAIVHTTPVTVESLKALAGEILPGYEVVNFVDDSILPQLKANEGKVEEVEARLIQYYKFAEEVGADVVLNACSSVGEVVQKGQSQVNIPIVRIDDAMAEEAVRRGERIGVAATLNTTLRPTLDLIEARAVEAEGNYRIVSLLVSEAYERLIAGDKEGHDAVLAAALLDFAQDLDVVVLAQASMARVVQTLPADVQDRFLSSPRLGMERVKSVVEKTNV